MHKHDWPQWEFWFPVWVRECLLLIVFTLPALRFNQQSPPPHSRPSPESWLLTRSGSEDRSLSAAASCFGRMSISLGSIGTRGGRQQGRVILGSVSARF